MSVKSIRKGVCFLNVSVNPIQICIKDLLPCVLGLISYTLISPKLLFVTGHESNTFLCVVLFGWSWQCRAIQVFNFDACQINDETTYLFNIYSISDWCWKIACAHHWDKTWTIMQRHTCNGNTKQALLLWHHYINLGETGHMYWEHTKEKSPTKCTFQNL